MRWAWEEFLAAEAEVWTEPLPDGGVDVVGDVANLYGGHNGTLLSWW